MYLHAAVVDDWGTITTPLQEDLTFSFEQNDITKNFTDEYTFSLEGDAGAAYEVTFNMDFCSYGCGNVDTTYAIYDLNGSMYSDVSADGIITLESGDYSFEVKATGVGAGNSIDYYGSVTFTNMASPAPEPPAFLLILVGIFIAWLNKIKNRFRGVKKSNKNEKSLSKNKEAA